MQQNLQESQCDLLKYGYPKKESKRIALFLTSSMSSSTTDDDSCSYFFFRQACLIPTPSVPTHPSVSIKIYPPFAEFIDFGGASRHILTNNGTCRIVFKVKCSNNLVFKVSPVYAFLDPGATAELQVSIFISFESILIVPISKFKNCTYLERN